MLRYAQTWVSLPEQSLIEAIREVQYGEIFGAEVVAADQIVEMELSSQELNLVQLIRSGMQNLSVITIHQGQPQQIECDFKIRELRCRKRIKIPTT